MADDQAASRLVDLVRWCSPFSGSRVPEPRLLLSIGADLPTYLAANGNVSDFQLTRGNRMLVRGSINELWRDGLGALSRYREGVAEVLIAYVNLPSLDFMRHLPNVTRLRVLSPSLGEISGLRHLHKLSDLSLERPNYRLDVIGDLQGLTHLYLDDWRPGVKSIFGLTRLRRLGIQKYGFTNFEPTSAWIDLEDLWVNAGRLETLSGVPPSLTKLRLTCQRKLSDLSALAACRNLEELQLQSCRRIESLDGLQRCTRLRKLGIARGGRLKNLDPVAGLPLDFLFLGDSTTIEDVEAVYTLRALRTLIIVRTAGLDRDRMLQVAPGCDIRITKR